MKKIIITLRQQAYRGYIWKTEICGHCTSLTHFSAQGEASNLQP